MPMKGSGASDLREIDRWDGGVGWLAYPDEDMQRASHALVDGDDVYVVDPVDAEGVDDLLAHLGEVAGVLVLLDRHKRDADAIARRHDAPVMRPRWMGNVDRDIDAPVETLGRELGGTGFAVRKRMDTPFWKEAVLYRERDGTLLVPEALGTVAYYRTGDERAGVHPMLRFTPPRELADLDVERLLVGHGAGLDTDVNRAIADAIDGSLRRAPKLYLQALKGLVG